ncbi:MAG TPA: DinB family protein [Candidatus Limnocylindria bacterium]|nr:DinB family protein [Candidatus Limnocylindria bacterium]
MTVVDPVSQGTEYQRLLLSLLGDRDPAQVMQATPARLRAMAAAAGAALRARPEPTEWSVFECVAHIADAELVISGRLRFILAQDRPPLPGYDQDLWVDKLHQSHDESLDELLAWFEPLRTANLRMWNESSESDRARVGMHSERGPESFELTFRLYAGHDLFHIGQAEKTLGLVAAHRV